MRIKIFTPNENGKIELSKEELENLLNETYRQGWNDKPYYYDRYWYNSPTLTATTAMNAVTAHDYSINNSSTSITNTCAEALEKDMETFKIALKEYEVKTPWNC